jgi:hypothetical protein
VKRSGLSDFTVCAAPGSRTGCKTALEQGARLRGSRVFDNLEAYEAFVDQTRKPGAFARWVLRDAAFRRTVYRQTWKRLVAALSEREACKTIVGLLGLAADGHEAQLADELEQLIELTSGWTAVPTSCCSDHRAWARVAS